MYLFSIEGGDGSGKGLAAEIVSKFFNLSSVLLPLRLPRSREGITHLVGWQ